MNYEFMQAGKANAEIWRLEKLLGMEQGEPIFHLKKFNARIVELRKLIDATKPANAVAASASKELEARAEKLMDEHLTKLFNGEPTKLASKITGAHAVGAKPLSPQPKPLQPQSDPKLYACLKHSEFLTADPKEACPLCSPPISAKALTRQQMREVGRCFPEFDCAESASDSEYFAKLCAVAYQNFLRLPNMESDQVLSSRYKRDTDPSGMAKIVRAVRGQRIAQILKS